MKKVYERADKELREMVRDAMAMYQPVLAYVGVEVDTLVVVGIEGDDDHPIEVPCLSHNGYAAIATIKIIGAQQRALGQGDALLTIDKCEWKNLKHAERMAVLDHELEHLEVRGRVFYDPDTKRVSGKADEDDYGRPKLRMRLHDWQIGGFRNVVARHKFNAAECRQVEACRDRQTGQYFWNWAAYVLNSPNKVEVSVVSQGEETLLYTAGGSEELEYLKDAERELDRRAGPIRKYLDRQSKKADEEKQDQAIVLNDAVIESAREMTQRRKARSSKQKSPSEAVEGAA